MSELAFKLPATEMGIIWRYLDGVSQAVAKRFNAGSSPGEENLTFLLCELLDEGTTALHMLEYPLQKAKQDLALADAGITLDVSFKTHEHTKHVEHNFSGADLGIVFVAEHPYYGRSERAVLLQAKRLFPTASGFALNSAFDSFHVDQRDFLKKVQARFSAGNSIFYLWYAPSSGALSTEEAKLACSLEATTASGWHDMRGYHPALDEILELGWPWNGRDWTARSSDSRDEERQRAWRAAQPATRVSSLLVVDELTTNGRPPRLISLYNARALPLRQRRHWRALAFEPFAELFFLGLLSRGIGNSSPDWLRLARGESVAMPAGKSKNDGSAQQPDAPEHVPAPKHSLTFTLRSSLQWPQDLPRPERERQAG